MSKFQVRFTRKHLIFLGYCLFIVYLFISYFVNLFSLSNLSEIISDYGSFIASGLLSNSGTNPYSIDNPFINYVSFPSIGVQGIAPNLNPPISVLLFEFLAKFNIEDSIHIWRILMGVLFLISVIILELKYPAKAQTRILRVFWALSLAGFWHMIRIGQIYGFVSLFSVLAWVLIREKKYILAGIFLGLLIAIKPNFVFWALILLIVGNWRLFLYAGITAVCISLIPIFTHGIEIYYQWIEATSLYTPDLLAFPGNNSISGLLVRFGLTHISVLENLIFVAFIIIFIKIAKPGLEIINGLGLISSLLISPIAWTGYTILILPVFYMSKWKWPHYTAALIFSIPFAVLLYLYVRSPFNFVFWGWFYGWGLLILLTGLIIHYRGRSSSQNPNDLVEMPHTELL